MRRSSTSRARSYTVSSDQDHRRGESLGKPILINPASLIGAMARLFNHAVLSVSYQSRALFRVTKQE
jgi:hypothetical protein